MSFTESFFDVLEKESPLPIVGVIHALAAKMAAKSGFQALYVSGAGVANASLGLPDLGMSSLNDVCEDVRRIAGVTNLPILVDADTGWGSPLNVERSIRELGRAGAAGAHLEDQDLGKRCGHREGKQLVSSEVMCERIQAGLQGKPRDDFMLMARTDALANEGLDKAISRAQAYVEAGANAIFAEAVTDIKEYKVFTQALSVPVLANITEFGKTPLFSKKELASAGIAMMLHPLSAFRAMNAAAMTLYQTLYEEGSVAELMDTLQTRDALYDLLDYQRFEKTLD